MSKDDTAANDAVVADTTPTETAPVENESTVTADNALDDDAFDDIDDEEAKDAETGSDNDGAAEPAKPEPTAEETQADNQPTGEQPKSPENDWNSLKGTSKERFEQMSRRIAELEAEKARIATEQDLVNEINPDTGEYYTPQEIERISWQQSREAQAERVNQEMYQLQVQQNQQAIEDEAAQVAELDLFNPKSKDFNQEIVAEYAQTLNENLIYVLPDGRQATRSDLMANGFNPDTQATLVGSNVSPLKLAKLIANSYTSAKTQGQTIGQANAQRATERMLASADVTGSSSQATAKDDASDFDEAWDE